MLLAGILWARPASVTVYSAKLPAAELITRSPGLKSLTSPPTASISPAHSRPTMVPVPPTVPWRWPDATARSARLSDAARTLTRISCGLGTGLATSRISTPFSPTTAAFIFPPLRRHRPHASAISAISASAMPIRAEFGGGRRGEGFPQFPQFPLVICQSGPTDPRGPTRRKAAGTNFRYLRYFRRSFRLDGMGGTLSGRRVSATTARRPARASWKNASMLGETGERRNRLPILLRDEKDMDCP